MILSVVHELLSPSGLFDERTENAEMVLDDAKATSIVGAKRCGVRLFFSWILKGD